MCGVTEDVRARVRASTVQAAIVLGVFAVASLVGAVIWRATVDLPRWQRTGSDISMGAVEATKTVGIDAVYLFVSVPIALALGAGLMYLLRRSPVTTVAFIALAGVCAAALMERFGLLLGPGSPADALRHAATGATAPVQLKVQATGVLMAWPGAAVLGALLVLLAAPSQVFDPVDDAPAPADSARLNELPTA